MAELHAVRITPVLAANAKLDVGARGASFHNGSFDELANAGLIQSGERVLLEDFVFGIGQQEVAHVITADTQSCLREVPKLKNSAV